MQGLENSVFSAMYQSGVVPVVTLSNPRLAVGLARALLRGGIRVLEIAMREQGAEDCIRAVRDEVPEMTIGAGTVLTASQMEAAAQAGAMYAVAPGLDEHILALSLEKGIPFIPGVVGSTEIQKGLSAGLSVLKFFPAEPLGGLSTINYLAAPFPMVRFLPAGGVGFHNLSAYLAHPSVLACAGGFISRGEQIQREDWDTIVSLSSKASKIARARSKK